ncbi:MAG: hypothetical protein K0S32_159 [Bacteroidetes bacterium]|jgi:hypothetical protein|nr:hypothetical protein [Bacteroidota bacterium]
MAYTGFFILVFVLLPAIMGGIIVYSRLMPRRKKEQGFEFVYIEKDGTVRELNGNEEDFLNQPFFPGDPNKPYIKRNYDDRLNGDISGFILRERVPATIKIRKKDHRAINPN